MGETNKVIGSIVKRMRYCIFNYEDPFSENTKDLKQQVDQLQELWMQSEATIFLSQLQLLKQDLVYKIRELKNFDCSYLKQLLAVVASLVEGDCLKRGEILASTFFDYALENYRYDQIFQLLEVNDEYEKKYLKHWIFELLWNHFFLQIEIYDNKEESQKVASILKQHMFQEEWDLFYQNQMKQKISQLEECCLKKNRHYVMLQSLIDSFQNKALFFNRNIMTLSSNRIKGPTSFMDLRDQQLFTIDPKGSYLLDDAFSCSCLENGNYLVGIYIAYAAHYANDIKHFVWPGHDKDKIKVYSYLQMLQKINKQHLSLLKNKERYVMAHFIELTPNGELVSFEVKPALIRVAANYFYKYQQIDFSLPSEVKQLYDLLRHLYLKNLEMQQYYSIKQLAFKVKQKSNEAQYKAPKGNNAFDPMFFIQQLKLLLGSDVLGIYCKQNNIPCIYKVNELQYNDKILRILETLCRKKDFNQAQSFLKKMRYQSRYSMEPLPHMGFGKEAYLKAFIPLRDVYSLLFQKLEDELFVQKETDFSQFQKVFQHTTTYLNSYARSSKK